jgi:outer membrane receptor protein involved in Fe transport
VFKYSIGGKSLNPSYGTTPSDASRTYTYSTWHLGRDIDLTAGVAYGRVKFSAASVPPSDERTRTEEEVDPKAGIVFRLTPTTTLRGTYFETLGAAGNADLESIEPTQIAGFNQLFDDPPGTRTRAGGVGLDQKIAKWTYVGMEAMWRNPKWSLGKDLQPARVNSTDDVVVPLHAQERSLRAHVYQVLHRTTTATIDYTLLDREDDSSFLGDVTDDHSLTHRIRLGLNYFDPHGWFSGLGATWRHQRLEDFERAADGVANGARDFWILDATVGYQFPRRLGYIAFTFDNLLDRDFRYQPVGIDQRLLPEFSANMRLFVNF